MAGRGRPRRTYSFPKAEVKRANERLRKLESVHKTFYGKDPSKEYDYSHMSRAYRDVKRYAERAGTKTKPNIYRIDENGAIRFMTKAEYEKLDDKGKKYFEETLRNFLEDETSTKMGVERAYQKAYDKFIKQHSQYKNMSFEEYMDTWKGWHDLVKADKDNHYSYDKLTLLINNGEFNSKTMEELTAEQVEQTQHYQTGISDQMTRGKGRRSRKHHYANPNRPMADRASRRPNRYT